MALLSGIGLGAALMYAFDPDRGKRRRGRRTRTNSAAATDKAADAAGATAPATTFGQGVRGSGPMILHWEGQGWTAVTHPRAFPNAAILRAVATSSGGGAWSVGGEIEVSASGSVTPERTLINRYTP